ncbi:hypothetical protein MAL1_00074 [Bacteriophage DSS3_MAL1]|nr:hypothetical protein MAL1_00074 [Bacteriophage DSS3_MAL1]
MSFADANRASIRVIEETTWGTTPSSGATREVRLTSSSLSAEKETVISDELRADRMVSAITEVSAMSSGDINFEHSAGAQDEFLAAFLMGAWSRPMSRDFFKGQTISVTGTNEVTVAGKDVTGYIAGGRRIKLAGFVNAENNGYFSVSSVALSGSDTVVTLVENTLVAETGTVRARLFDANDVVVLNNTSIEATATGFSGTGAFTAAVAAGQLKVGQKIFVEGLGFEAGTIVASDALSTLVVTISDGTNSAQLTAGTDYTVGVDAATDAAALAAAINAQRVKSVGAVNVKAVASAGTVTVTNLNVTGGSITEDTSDGNATVTDFSGGVADVRGTYTITSLSNDAIVTNPAPAGVVAAGAPVTIKGSMLRNPGSVDEIVQRKFTIETAFNDIGQYMVQDGMVPGTFSLEVATGAIITGTIGFQGRATQLRQSTVLGDVGSYTVLGAQTGEVMNATTNVGEIEKDGSTFGASIQSISISGEANLRQQAAVGSKFAKGIGAGRFNLTGSMTVYFEDEQLFNDFINHETVALSFAVTDLDGQTEIFTIPAIKFSQDQIAPGGIDQDVFDNVEWTAFRDPTTECMIQIDRFSPNTAV